MVALCWWLYAGGFRW